MRTALSNQPYISIFCGPASHTANQAAALSFARIAVAAGYGLVCGHVVGWLRPLVERVTASGGKVISVMPANEKTAYSNIPVYRESTVEACRKKMLELSVGYIILPGGLCSLEALHWLISYHHTQQTKPGGVLNIHNYFTGTLTQLERTVMEGFISKAEYERLTKWICFSDQLPELINHIKNLSGIKKAPIRETRWWEEQDLPNVAAFSLFPMKELQPNIVAKEFDEQFKLHSTF